MQLRRIHLRTVQEVDRVAAQLKPHPLFKAEHDRAVASNHEAEATEHAELAAKYKANPTISDMKRPGAPDTAAHCLAYAEHCRKAAKTRNDMAAMHEGMAKAIK